ncbi:F0F1 ATP synthase subunit B [Anaerorhabdus furcosa]|uniref:ATP synthase subunit b n=1 Tax=Anaerorhabdus furcosa TaxID=118967 RepID=A0A1T4KB61_9FIRM|nr:F0F1 ATP synthase subunit B [Anaerorhabdus furcosa]SJZ39573.1 F-type H+-transporting ATPase subunit b [Anaerorhabdus furcosa]
MMIDIDIAQQLFPNPLTMFIQLCATGVLFFFAYKFLWDPARALLAKRSDFVHTKLSEAERSLQEARSERQKAHDEVSNAYHKSQEIIAKAENEAKAVKEDILEQAKNEATSKLEKAREEIAIEKSQMREGMVDEMVTVAMLATEKLISEKVDSTYDQKTIENFVKEMSNHNGSIS